MTGRFGHKRAILFDFDGTLVDSMETFADIAAEVMPRHLPIERARAREQYRATSGLPFFQQLELLFPGNAANAAAAEDFEREKLVGYYERPLFADAVDTLATLRERGIAVGVSSNNFQELVDRFVARAGLPLDFVLGFRPGFAKGAAHFAHIVETLGCARDALLFVGVSLHDGEKAGDAGIDFVGRTGTFTRADFAEHFPETPVIATLAELPALLSGGTPCR